MELGIGMFGDLSFDQTTGKYSDAGIKIREILQQVKLMDEVGIDVESLDRDFSVVEKKALSEDEIDDLEKDKRNEQLAIYWCAKEAIYKRMSQNRVVYAEQIEVEKFNVRKEGELEATFIHKDEHEEEFELEYMIFDRHVLVWLVG